MVMISSLIVWVNIVIQWHWQRQVRLVLVFGRIIVQEVLIIRLSPINQFQKSLQMNHWFNP